MVDLQEFRLYFQQNITLHSVLDQLDSPGKKFHLKGLSGSSRTLFSAALSEHLHKPVLYLLPNREEAAYFYDDLINLGTGVPVLFFPASCRRPVQFDRPDQENIILRTSVLNQLLQPEPFSIVSYPEALAEKVITGETLSAHSFQIRKGDRLSIDFLNDVLYEYGFERVDFVTEAGQFALRGSLVDVFSFSEEDPYRIDFLNDRIDSIRLFGVADQISVSQADQMVIIPDIQNSLEGENRDQFLNLLPPGSVVVSQDVSLVSGLIDDLNRQARFAGMDEPGLRLSSGSEFLDLLNRFTCLEAGIKCHFPDAVPFEFHTSPQPVFHKNFELLAKNLQKRACSGYHNFILSSNEKQIERIKAIFEAQGLDVPFTGLGLTLHEGFLDHELKLCCYTDHQIFERYHRFRIKSRKDQKENLSLKELNTLHPGDYVVHIDHGIGKFAGLVKTRINGKMQETIRLVYRDNDVLLVSIHSLHRITRYKGKDGLEPKINKLGSGAWQKLKDRTKSKVKDIARELIALYALRKQEKGFAYSADSYMQKELEASFIFEDTPDQTKATQAVKEDMEKPIPMDRLVCGDVGFGKTEIAIRAAFKAIADGKQVAVLVPTTILALQHYRTFSDRLNNFPVKLDHISRLRQPAEIKDILKQLREGRIDLLIGTHRLIGKDVKFKDLGLLIVDEEQKFGVSVKEKLKQLKVNVDTLTLTATPIPRTLQFSLMGARDLSIIQTPPPNRFPIITELHGFNEEIVREAISYELARSGQVFFVHNRVQNIYAVEETINRILPGARTMVAHGQMEGKKLERIMLGFIRGEFDVLIATTIIESGLDIPNANTIIINHAENFGLSDLHQLRGRVGRSNKKAFCYLLTPPLSAVNTEARRRLQAVEEFSDLGSGFDIAMRDLDIRGAGNLLGAEQSGFIADIGFETYHHILNEAIQELKQEEYPELFREDKPDPGKASLSESFVRDCQIDTDMELLFPDTYIRSVSERMLLYRELDELETEESLQQFENGLVDRFGPLPASGSELLEVVRLRWLAIELGMERIILKNKKMICCFVSEQQSPFYQSPVFSRILQYVQQNSGKCRMKEKASKLSLRFEPVERIASAKLILTGILQST